MTMKMQSALEAGEGGVAVTALRCASCAGGCLSSQEKGKKVCGLQKKACEAIQRVESESRRQGAQEAEIIPNKAKQKESQRQVRKLHFRGLTAVV